MKVMLDANAINSRQRDRDINQLERWRDNDVILLLMPDSAYDEAMMGGDSRRVEKTATHVSANSGRITEEDRRRYACIEAILFPNGVQTQNQRNDVDIVYESAAWGYILVTNDGDSRRQPRGILGCSAQLASFGARVMRPREAVALIRTKVLERDEREASICDALGVLRPEWLGRD